MTQTTCSNINLRLGQILRKYQVELERQEERNKSFWMRGKAVKPLSLYVFTDAAWQGCDAVAPIEAMIEKQKQLELPKEQVGIQFIRFGNDPTGMERLEYLDRGLRRKYTKRWYVHGLPLASYIYPILTLLRPPGTLSIQSHFPTETCLKCFSVPSPSGSMMTEVFRIRLENHGNANSICRIFHPKVD